MNIIFADISPTAKFVVGHPFLILKGYKHFLILKVPNKSILPKFQINTSSQLVYPTQFNYSQPFLCWVSIVRAKLSYLWLLSQLYNSDQHINFLTNGLCILPTWKIQVMTCNSRQTNFDIPFTSYPGQCLPAYLLGD